MRERAAGLGCRLWRRGAAAAKLVRMGAGAGARVGCAFGRPLCRLGEGVGFGRRAPLG